MHRKFRIIAETSFSHQGSLDYLISQIEAAKKGRVDYIKFQILLDKKEAYTPGCSLYDKLDDWTFNRKKWKDVFAQAKSLGLRIIALPLDRGSLDFCLENDSLISMYEIHSVCFNDYFILNRLKNNPRKLILGIGGRTTAEIEFAQRQLAFDKKNTILMYGFQSFPTQRVKVNLNKIKTFKEFFNCDVGYADHTAFEDNYFYNMVEYAYILGAIIFEKHIVVNKGEKRVDYESAIDSEGFREIRKRLDNLTALLGDGDINCLNDKEIAYKNREKKIVASRDINKGVIQWEDLTYKISDQRSDFQQSDIISIVGSKAVKKIKKDTPLRLKHLDGAS